MTANPDPQWEVTFTAWGTLPVTEMPPGWEPFAISEDDETGVTIWLKRAVKLTP